MLRFEGVSFRYPEDELGMVENLSFQVADGEFVAIIGASGCGKSTVFRLINGLERPDGGKILVDEKPIETIKNYSAFMPQKDLLFPWRSVEKNVSLPMELGKVPMGEQEKRAALVLEQVGLADYAKKYPKDLSGGMKQRVSFARTLLSGADMLLLDEPFSALDYLTRVEMQEWLLAQWAHYHKTILFITHDVEEAIFLAKRIYIIQDARPFTQMESIEVPLGYPRNREALKQGEIVELKESLIGKLRRSVSL
ncbi:aliphatic sulfonates import ATP-binding protein SsuB [Anaerotignum neopropionicum]|uniref:Aliphatic sulfonates import ATP-binding protein SsuB n=1 Tax=Anaerotignum neopropionicum TaxID=36847 RepID=A0A136WI88_9FIRM|nr:ABC transporter ATP-binding protein [Anaerotignum neopropionicum]KXL54069.1 aliphatic sulfonates import ATP-binding protein SsuB [Anaerotignum neopropionicum]